MIVNRTYVSPSTGMNANVFVSWYGSRRIAAAAFAADMFAVWRLGDRTRGARRSDHLFRSHHGEPLHRSQWRRTRCDAVTGIKPRVCVIAGEWAAKFWRVKEAVLTQRTDVAFVRVFVPFALTLSLTRFSSRISGVWTGTETEEITCRGSCARMLTFYPSARETPDRQSVVRTCIPPP